MKSIAINENNDLFVFDGEIKISSGIDAIIDRCKQAVMTKRGEVVFNLNEGVNTFSSIWVGVPNITHFEVSAKEQLLNVEDVVSIIDFSSSIIGEVLQYSATIETNFGAVNINGNL